ncbi:MAG: glycosyltransferase family 4 protein [Candidatus Peribacter sp.]|nr:glycosyltransferase family 4 protein [Candidatus Peribacter sp.]
MRILFTRFPLESRYGGAEVQTMALMHGLAARKHGVAFLGSCPTLLKLCWNEDILAAELAIGDPPVTKWGALSFLWRKQAMQRRLISAIEEFGPIDALVMLSMTEKLLLTPFARERGIRVIWVEHDRVGRWLSNNPWLPMLRRASEGATIVTVSDLSRAIYVDQLGFAPERVIAIGNGVDAKHLAGEGKYPRPERTALHVGTVARLSRDKGVDLLMNAIADLPGVTLDIMPTGEQGSDEPAVRALASQINAGCERIRFLSPSATSMGAFYQSLDVFVLPSRQHDPCPLAPMEALWMGTPVIMTDACGTAGYLKKEEETLVVPAESVPALKDALQKMQNQTFRQSIAHRGKVAARERFSLEKMVDAYEALLASPPASGS